MARRSRQSVLKRQRELKRMEKAETKRRKREERRRIAIEGPEGDIEATDDEADEHPESDDPGAPETDAGDSETTPP